jgi:hypothetical protein
MIPNYLNVAGIIGKEHAREQILVIRNKWKQTL